MGKREQKREPMTGTNKREEIHPCQYGDTAYHSTAMKCEVVLSED